MTKSLSILDRIVNVERRQLAIYCISLCSALLAKGLSLVPGYALDDYAGTYADQSIAFYMSQGRFTQAGLQWFLTLTGLSTTDVAWASTALSLGALAAIAGFIANKFDRPNISIVFPAAWAAIICSFPYFTEYFTFRQSLYNCSFYLILTIAHLVVIDRLDRSKGIFSIHNRFNFCIAILLLLLAIGGHQMTVAIAGSASLSIAFASETFRKGSIRDKANVCLRFVAPSLAALIIYIMIYMVIKGANQVSVDARGNLLQLSDAPKRIRLILELLYKVFFTNEPTYSWIAKMLVILGLFPAIVVAAFKRPSSAIFWMLGFGMMIALAILPLAASGVWWPVPRSMAAIGFVLGAMSGSLYIIADIRRPIFAVPFILASVVMTFNCNAMLRQQLRLNRWDLSRAQLLVHDIQSRYGSGTLPTVIIVGAKWDYPTTLSSTTGDLNISALSVAWARTGLLREASGVNITVKPSNPEWDLLCKGHTSWPSDGGITEVSDHILVCL